MIISFSAIKTQIIHCYLCLLMRRMPELNTQAIISIHSLTTDFRYQEIYKWQNEFHLSNLDALIRIFDLSYIILHVDVWSKTYNPIPDCFPSFR